MEEPSPRSSRLALAGALVAAIAVGGAGFLLGRSTSERPPPAIAPPIAVAPPKAAPEPVASGVLGRADLIALAAAAADAATTGRDPGPDIAQAEGRRFELRLPFGCADPAGAESGDSTGWRYDPKAQALRISIAPMVWTAQDWWSPDAADGVEAIEGFWIERPWTSSEACPGEGRRPAGAGTPETGRGPAGVETEWVLLPGQTLALGQIFLAGGGRGGRRDGKPFEAVVPIAEDRLDTSRGLRLRISGRIARAGNSGPVRCRQPAGSEQRPICLVGVVMDEVAVENPASGATLATWSLGTGKAPED